MFDELTNLLRTLAESPECKIDNEGVKLALEELDDLKALLLELDAYLEQFSNDVINAVWQSKPPTWECFKDHCLEKWLTRH